MLIIDTLFILGVYTASRLRERHKNKQKISSEKISSLVALEDPEIQQHYVSVGSGTIVLSIMSAVFTPLKFVNFFLIVYSTLPVLRRAEHSLIKEHKLQNDTLSAIVSIVSLGTGVQLAAAIQTCIYHLGCQMVSRSKDLSTQALSNVFNQQSTQVWIVRDQIEIQIEMDKLQLNDIVVIKTGEMIPIDGIVIKGHASVDQRTLTGESMPIEKELMDQVFASTLIVGGKLHIRVEKTGTETTISQLSDILQNTANFKTQLQLKGEKWANATITPLMSGSFLSLPFLGLSAATALLFSAPTNSIKVMTSMQTYNYMTLIASHSILIKDGRALEALGSIDVVLFDKTGTLTEDEPKIAAIKSFAELNEDELLSYAATAEMRLTHPIAQAIVREAKRREIKLFEIDEAYYKIGQGVTVQLNGQQVQVGSGRFMQKEGLVLPKTANPSAIFIAIDAKIEGCIELKTHIRQEMPQVIGVLREQGIKEIMIVSGDHQQPTQELAEHLAIDDYFYEILPEDKAKIVERLQDRGHKVCFVGDGINDTLAMQKADVSISLSGAASIATDMAQVVFMDGHLVHLNTLFELSKELNSSLEKTLLFCASFGVGNIVLTTLHPLGLMRSALLFAGFFTIGTGQAMLPLMKIGQYSAYERKKLR